MNDWIPIITQTKVKFQSSRISISYRSGPQSPFRAKRMTQKAGLVKQINSQSDLINISMSSLAGLSYLTIRSSVYIF